jgi:hypothetical protein
LRSLVCFISSHQVSQQEVSQQASNEYGRVFGTR